MTETNFDPKALVFRQPSDPPDVAVSYVPDSSEYTSSEINFIKGEKQVIRSAFGIDNGRPYIPPSEEGRPAGCPKPVRFGTDNEVCCGRLSGYVKSVPTSFFARKNLPADMLEAYDRLPVRYDAWDDLRDGRDILDPGAYKNRMEFLAVHLSSLSLYNMPTRLRSSEFLIHSCDSCGESGMQDQHMDADLRDDSFSSDTYTELSLASDCRNKSGKVVDDGEYHRVDLLPKFAGCSICPHIHPDLYNARVPEGGYDRVGRTPLASFASKGVLSDKVYADPVVPVGSVIRGLRAMTALERAEDSEEIDFPYHEFYAPAFPPVEIDVVHAQFDRTYGEGDNAVVVPVPECCTHVFRLKTNGEVVGFSRCWSWDCPECGPLMKSIMATRVRHAFRGQTLHFFTLTFALGFDDTKSAMAWNRLKSYLRRWGLRQTDPAVIAEYPKRMHVEVKQKDGSYKTALRLFTRAKPDENGIRDRETDQLYFLVKEFTSSSHPYDDGSGRMTAGYRRHYHGITNFPIPFEVLQHGWLLATEGTSNQVDVSKVDSPVTVDYIIKYIDKGLVNLPKTPDPSYRSFLPNERRYTKSIGMFSLKYKSGLPARSSRSPISDPESYDGFRHAPLPAYCGASIGIDVKPPPTEHISSFAYADTGDDVRTDADGFYTPDEEFDVFGDSLLSSTRIPVERIPVESESIPLPSSGYEEDVNFDSAGNLLPVIVPTGLFKPLADAYLKRHTTIRNLAWLERNRVGAKDAKIAKLQKALDKLHSEMTVDAIFELMRAKAAQSGKWFS